MKRCILFAIIAAMLLTMSSAFAEDLGIQIIGGKQTSETVEPLSLDDIQIGKVYTLNGAIAVPNEFLTVDCFAQFFKESKAEKYVRTDRYGGGEWLISAVYSNSNSKCEKQCWRYGNAGWCDSGVAAQFVWLRMDITCTNPEMNNLSETIEVKLVYDNEYEFGGWIRQIDYADTGKSNYSNGGITRCDFTPDMYPQQIVYHPDNAPAVGFMVTGNYVLGCTLPNYVLEDTKTPLSMVITIDGNEITYNIRK